MGFELTLLALSVVLLFVHIGVQGVLLTRDLGSAYNAGPRDENRALGPLAGRAERALRNFLETWPAFIALALIAGVTGTSNGLTQWGAGLYLAFRIVYIPLYLLGIPYLRSLAFIAASLGLFLMLIGLLV
jgi:uncharacterized MAPEG superfamily protein